MLVSSCSRFALLFVALALLAPTYGVRAADDTEQINEKRYYFEKIEGVLYRFDSVTGKMQKLQRNGVNFTWVDVETAESNTAPRQDNTASRKEERPPKPKDSTLPHLDEKKKREPGQIKLFNADDEEITDVVTDEDRKRGAGDVATYEPHMSISHTLKTDDKIEGTLLIRNLGQKRLRVLELTMVLQVIGRDKPEEHRFVFVDQPGRTGPPQPGANGKDPLVLLQKVSIPCPAGGVKGQPELRMTYIRYTE